MHWSTHILPNLGYTLAISIVYSLQKNKEMDNVYVQCTGMKIQLCKISNKFICQK
jgi:hypothetical protein